MAFIFNNFIDHLVHSWSSRMDIALLDATITQTTTVVVVVDAST